LIFSFPIERSNFEFLLDQTGEDIVGMMKLSAVPENKINKNNNYVRNKPQLDEF